MMLVDENTCDEGENLDLMEANDDVDETLAMLNDMSILEHLI